MKVDTVDRLHLRVPWLRIGVRGRARVVALDGRPSQAREESLQDAERRRADPDPAVRHRREAEVGRPGELDRTGECQRDDDYDSGVILGAVSGHAQPPALGNSAGVGSGVSVAAGVALGATVGTLVAVDVAVSVGEVVSVDALAGSATMSGRAVGVQVATGTAVNVGVGGGGWSAVKGRQSAYSSTATMNRARMA
jgi:hypothetical protein